MNLLDSISMKLNEKVMFSLFFDCGWRVAIFSRKAETLVVTNRNEVAWKVEVPNEVQCSFSKMFLRQLKLVILSRLERTEFEWALEAISLVKSKWSEEDALVGKWERIDLQKLVGYFFLSNWCISLMSRR